MRTQSNFSTSSSSSSSWPASVSRWCAHSRSVVFHTLYIGQRDTILFPLLVKFSTLYSLLVPRLGSLHFCPLRHSSILSLSSPAAAATISLAPAGSMSSCPHHRIPTRDPGVLSTASHRSRSDHVEMYCMVVFLSVHTYAIIQAWTNTHSNIRLTYIRQIILRVLYPRFMSLF